MKPRYWLLALYSTLRHIWYALVPNQFLWDQTVENYILVDQTVEGWMTTPQALTGVIYTMTDPILPWPILLILRQKMI